jgi:hypothetical protein
VKETIVKESKYAVMQYVNTEENGEVTDLENKKYSLS